MGLPLLALWIASYHGLRVPWIKSMVREIMLCGHKFLVHVADIGISTSETGCTACENSVPLLVLACTPSHWYPVEYKLGS